ncbi:MAG: ABC transporter ATP-binding protein [Betaproteobacteria bacterium]|jgi:lipoprotein-releasing system ATP-binding protein|nr:ABC transporter ATP-binding protein [Pseudomonadota bacterium]NBP35094.1 ABC transporter ATP-binding protein [Betaproteobacteria bacterium]NBP37443.1 ABC transporter ATP-binding protein [Betaproteobacteria bacterium]NBQ78825.1 ABC transporter ATP-binding protein [Betaproteobacteria bacterium]NBS39500.1 ABC transporter ATP-binding protein [Betaproteobacteria bacterium]
MADLLVVEGLTKSYIGPAPGSPISILREVSMHLQAGESLAIMGRSGAGKSTLLHLLAGFEKPDSGHIQWEGVSLGSMKESAIDKLRNQRFGFVYQFHHLIEECSAIDNVSLPLRIGSVFAREARQQAAAMLTRLGLEDRLEHRPSALSGGERQRVAVARALVHRPACVLADEPTGNLDEQSAAQVFKLFRELAMESRTALLLVTHDHSLAKACDRLVVLENGKLTSVI